MLKLFIIPEGSIPSEYYVQIIKNVFSSINTQEQFRISQTSSLTTEENPRHYFRSQKAKHILNLKGQLDTKEVSVVRDGDHHTNNLKTLVCGRTPFSTLTLFSNVLS